MLQAILLGLISMLGNAEYLFGTSCLSRPLVMGALTGIVMGDIPTGVALGATLELAFMLIPRLATPAPARPRPAGACPARLP